MVRQQKVLHFNTCMYIFLEFLVNKSFVVKFVLQEGEKKVKEAQDEEDRKKREEEAKSLKESENEDEDEDDDDDEDDSTDAGDVEPVEV